MIYGGQAIGSNQASQSTASNFHSQKKNIPSNGASALATLSNQPLSDPSLCKRF